MVTHHTMYCDNQILRLMNVITSYVTSVTEVWSASTRLFAGTWRSLV